MKANKSKALLTIRDATRRGLTYGFFGGLAAASFYQKDSFKILHMMMSIGVLIGFGIGLAVTLINSCFPEGAQSEPIGSHEMKN